MLHVLRLVIFFVSDLPRPQIKVSEAEDRPPPPPFLKVINLEKLMTSNSAANLNTQDIDNTEHNSSIEEIADDICTPLSKVLRSTKKTNDYIKPVTLPMIPTQTFDCHLCLETFSHVEDFIIHQRFHDNEKSPKIHTQSFVCHLCQEIFSYEGDLVIHQRLHDNENPFKCDVCKATFASKGLYTSHKITHLMNKTELVCSLCPLRFVDEKSLKMHAKEEHYKCRFCKRNFDTPYALLMHLSRHDYCFLCNKIFKNLVSHNQKKHVDTNLSQIPIWQQQEILKRYFNKVLIIEPKSKGKDSKESEPKPGKEPAKICLKCNSELDERHICMNEADLRCFKCDVKFHNKSAFILHKRKHFYLYKRKFCNNCKKYMRKDGLINHKCSKVTKETNTKSTTTTENNEQADDIDDIQKESNDQSNVSDDLDNIILLSPEYVKMMMECKGFVPPPTPMFFDTSDIYYNT